MSLRNKTGKVHVVLRAMLSGLQKYENGKDFKVNTKYYFRTVYGVTSGDFVSRLLYLEGDAGTAALQIIFDKDITVEAFKDVNTAFHGCNPVMMLSRYFDHDYTDLVIFLFCLSTAATGDMTALFNYIYPHGHLKFKAAGVSKLSLEHPSFAIRGADDYIQLSRLEDYIKLLESIDC